MLFALAALPLAGCGGSGLEPVSGRVTHGGEGVPHVMLHLRGDDGGVAFALTDAEGRFTLQSQGGDEGVAPGTYDVSVTYQAPEPDPNVAEPPAEPAWLPLLQEKYGPGTSELRVEITGPQSDLELKLD